MGSMTDDTSVIPNWLNADFLKDILCKEVGKNVSVTHMDVKKALTKGENYLSIMYRVSVDYKENDNENGTKQFKVVVKALPNLDVLQKLLSEMKGVEKELFMYKTIFPSIYRIMKEKSPDRKLQPLSARCFPTARSDVIVLEDLQQFDYKMANRHVGLDVDHCRLTVKALARLHAGSLVLYNKDPSIMEVFEEGMYVRREEIKEQMHEHLKRSLKTISSNLEKWPGYEHFSEKLTNMSDVAYDRMVTDVTPKKHSFNVLNHGDCWVNNMLFQYCPQTGKVQEVRFVDFQIARFSSPALDLQYFLCTSPNDEVRLQEREHLLEVYHAELSDTMKQLGLDPDQFTLQQLKEEFEEKEFFGFITCCSILPTIIASKDDVPDLSELKDSDVDKDSLMIDIYSGKRFKEILQVMLKHYEDKNII